MLLAFPALAPTKRGCSRHPPSFRGAAGEPGTHDNAVAE